MTPSDVNVVRADGLKASTQAIHKKLEYHEMIRIMISGDCDPTSYAVYLWNLGQIYTALESAASEMHLISENLLRTERVLCDFQELWVADEKLQEQDLKTPPTFQSTRNHVTRIKNIARDQTLLMAHIYVRHLGDLQGGQLLKTKIPGSGTFYSFNDAASAIREIHSKLTDQMHEEAVRAFQFTHQLFDELLDFRNGHVLE